MHECGPLVHAALAALPHVAVPQPIRRELAEHADQVAVHALLLSSELLRILKLLEEAGISVLLWKGPALAAAAYGGLVTRIYADLDLLVSVEDVLAARTQLLTLGYTDDPPLTPEGARARLRSPMAHDFHLSSERGVTVELGWRIASEYESFGCEWQALWDRRTPVSIAGRDSWTLGREDLFLALCQHGARHRWEKLKWICDLAELTRAAPEMDWNALTNRARSNGSLRMLYLGALLANDLLEAPISPALLALARSDRSAAAQLLRTTERLFCRAENTPPGSDGWFYHWTLRERLRDRIPFLVHFVPRYLRRRLGPTERDRAVVRLPGVLSPLYYLIRPVRLVFDYAPRVLSARQPKTGNQPPLTQRELR